MRNVVRICSMFMYEAWENRHVCDSHKTSANIHDVRSRGRAEFRIVCCRWLCRCNVVHIGASHRIRCGAADGKRFGLFTHAAGYIIYRRSAQVGIITYTFDQHTPTWRHITIIIIPHMFAFACCTIAFGMVISFFHGIKMRSLYRKKTRSYEDNLMSFDKIDDRALSVS